MQDQRFSLRETKSARIKISLMNAFMESLREKAFDEISIKEVCRRVELSEPTFFKYFPEKKDVVAYYLQLLTKKIVGQALKYSSEGNSIQLINNIFSLMAQELTNRNEVYQILSVLLVQKEKLKNVAISHLEMELAFGNYKEEVEMEKIPSIYIDSFILQTVKKAFKDGELTSRTKCEEVTISLMSILIGTLFAVRFSDTHNCSYHYKRQLKTLWESLGVKNG